MDMDIQSETVSRIYAAWEKRGRSEQPRRYLGASIVGHECDRYLWLYFRGMFNERFDGRMYRLFNRGQREEEVFCSDLRAIGCEVWEVNPETKMQWAVSALGGHFGGHLDGVCRGVPEAPKTPHLTEFKTHNDASFTKLRKQGVKEAKPMHFAQMQTYMHLMHLTRALYLAVNKDTDELYSERVEYDRDAANAILIRAKRIIEVPNAERCARRPDDYRCKQCPAHAVCWHETGTVFSCPTGIIDCRSCCHATADTTRDGAAWTCRLGKPCTIGKNCGCKNHLVLPLLMDADIDTATELSVSYKIGDTTITNGNANGEFTSEELTKIGREPIASGAIQMIKAAIPGATVARQLTIPAEIDRMAERYEVFKGDMEGLRVFMAGNFHGRQVIARERDDDHEYFKFNIENTYIVVNNRSKTAIVYSDIPF